MIYRVRKAILNRGQEDIDKLKDISPRQPIVRLVDGVSVEIIMVRKKRRT